MSKNRMFFLCLFCFCVQGFVGCSIQKADISKQGDIEYTVVALQDVPEEMGIIEQNEKPFEITYEDQGYLYVAKGYGEQETSGYSIVVESCYESENTIFIKTKLIGPEKSEKIVSKPTYPYLVLKMENREKEVVFQ